MFVTWIHYLESLGLSGEWAVVFVTAALIIATILLIVPTALTVAYLHREFREKSLGKRKLINVCLVRDFDPGEVVGSFRATSMTKYLPVPPDACIDDAVNSRHPVVIMGRPGIGKSHCAIHHFAHLNNWYLLRPAKKLFDELASLHLKPRRYVLFLDDLHDYLAALPDGVTILDLIRAVKRCSTDLVVIATMRSILPEYRSGISDLKLFGTWTAFTLDDWTIQQGTKLASLTGKNLNFWDGTPLSVKSPSHEMMERYKHLNYTEQAILRGLKLAADHGIKPCSASLAKEIFVSDIFLRDIHDFAPAVQSILRHGFLKRADDVILAYDPYLDSISDWHPNEDSYRILVTLVSSKDRLDDLLQIGRMWDHSGEPARAEEIYRSAVQVNGDSEKATYLLGKVLGRTKRWEEAADFFHRAVVIAPKFTTAWLRYSEALKRAGRFEEADAARVQGLTLAYQSDPRARKKRDEKILRRTERATAAYEQAILLDPSTASEYLRSGITLWAIKDHVAAEQQFRHAIAANAQNALAYAYLGKILSAHGRNDEAIGAYQESLRLDSSKAEVHWRLGKALQAVHDEAGAERHFRRAVAADPQNPKPHFDLARFLSLRGKFNEAITAYEALIQLGAPSPSANFGLGIALHKTKNFDRAEQELRLVVAANPENAVAHSYLGSAIAAQGRSTEAILAYENALRVKPALNRTRLMLVREFMKIHKWEAALSSVTDALAIDPEMPEATQLRSEILTHLEKS